MQRTPGRVEDYTIPFLVTVGVFLFMVFFTIAAMFGFLWVVISAAGLDSLFRVYEAWLRGR